MVFDAASKYDKVSLNDNLLTGPDLLNSLVEILLRFRSGKIGIMANVEQFFHQVGVCEEDNCVFSGEIWMKLDRQMNTK